MIYQGLVNITGFEFAHRIFFAGIDEVIFTILTDGLHEVIGDADRYVEII